MLEVLVYPLNPRLDCGRKYFFTFGIASLGSLVFYSCNDSWSKVMHSSLTSLNSLVLNLICSPIICKGNPDLLIISMLLLMMQVPSVFNLLAFKGYLIFNCVHEFF